MSTSSSSSSSLSQSTVSASSISQMGQNAFLQLLAVQMQNQDPLNPVDNTQFVAQLAQFSSLQELTTISSQLGTMSTTTALIQNADQLYSAFNLMNTQVAVTNSKNIQVTGTVSGVTITNGQAYVEVNGQSYPLSSVDAVSTSTPITPPVTGSNTSP